MNVPPATYVRLSLMLIRRLSHPLQAGASAQLWGITDDELKAIQDALAEM